MHLDQNSHPLMVFKNIHDTEVNIWGAGKLIVDAVVFLSDISPAMLAVGKRMSQRFITSSKEIALDLVHPSLFPVIYG